MSNNIDKVFVVSHTHWDREWYQDFQTYRTRLVYLIDELIVTMESDPEYRYFMMDGQTIVIDDYLEIRPENRRRLLTLIQQGRITVGPWYVMPDEFLVSGESLIRNFLIGYRRARSWGVEPVKSGYVTDLFGHNSQFPQILDGFGIDNAVLFRGFYGDADASEIWWEGADGTRVIGLKLDEDRSYGDFYFFLRWPFMERNFEYNREELINRARSMLEYKSQRLTTSIMLGLDGVDHIEIEPQLPWMLKTLNEAELGVEFEHTHLEHYLQELRGKIGKLQTFKGELRTPGYIGVNNWVLANVLSSRIHLKQKNNQCETLLEKWVEPWGVFTALEGRTYSKGFINRAWEWLIENHPHDSICGCSINQVHEDMLYRFSQSSSISEQMLKEQLVYISNHLDLKEVQGKHVFTLFNSSQSSVDGVVEVDLALSSTDGFMMISHLAGTTFRIFDHELNEVPYQLLELKKGSTQIRRPNRDIPHGDIVDRYKIAIHAQVPAYGYSTYTLKSYPSEGAIDGEYSASRMSHPVRYTGSMQVKANTWDNGRLRVHIQTNGTVDLKDIHTGQKYEGLLSFEDEADVGDGWNHVPPVTNEVFTSQGAKSEISVVFNGPLLTRLRIRTTLSVPASILPSETRRSETFVELPITTYLDLRKDDPILRCRTVVTNTARDHRLKVLFPSSLQTNHYDTSTPFDLVRRHIEKVDYSGYMELDRDVVPHNGIIAIDNDNLGICIYSKGLYEVNARDDEARTIAMTLFRSTGKEVLCDGSDGGQLLGDLEFEYAVRPFTVNASYPSILWSEHQKFAVGIRSVDRKIGKIYYETLQQRVADMPLVKSFLAISTTSLIVSAIKEVEDETGRYIIRLLNVTHNQVQGTITFERPLSQVNQVNLDEQRLSVLPFVAGCVSLTVEPKQIITVEVTF